MSWVIWITGRPASGKSVLARAAADALRQEGRPVRVIETDEVRKVLTPAPGYSADERDAVYRAVGFMAATLAEAGVPVIVDGTAHRRAWRDAVRALVPCFAEVQLVCPLEVCQAREARRAAQRGQPGIYAGAGKLGAVVPGVDVPYEDALAPELVIDTARETPATAAARIVDLARALDPTPVILPPRRNPGWAVWITGRPGTGKTTLARCTAAALAGLGIETRLLDAERLLAAVIPERPGTPLAREIAYRAFAWTARLLVEAGIGVIVDAPVPRRAQRELARTLVPRFAEVQLTCPAEVSVERERAGRWRLGSIIAVGGRPCGGGPEVAIDYEDSPWPDLTLDTHVMGQWSAVQEVLVLVRRLAPAPCSAPPVVADPPCAERTLP
jgi:adenylylsulfate kinase